MIGPSQVLAIDNGNNVRDGFIITIADWDPAEEISLNWFLIDAAGNDIGYHNPSTGQVSGSEYGFGQINLVRLSSPAPPPLFNLNTGYDPPDSTNPNVDSAAFWAEDQDPTSGVDQYFVNPIPAGYPSQGTYFAIELGARVTGPFRNAADATGQFGGVATTRGANVTPNRGGPAVPTLSTIGIVVLTALLAAAGCFMYYRRLSGA